ncbi:MAG: hypothetical protein ABEI78_01070 [Candidatus Nanohaloarchaea archaeon]
MKRKLLKPDRDLILNAIEIQEEITISNDEWDNEPDIIIKTGDGL